MRLKLFIIFLLIIGLLAAFYIPGITIKVEASLYVGTCSPLSLDWSGTSILVQRLRNEGYNVVIVNKNSELINELNRGGLLLIIGPDKSLSANNTDLDLIEKYFLNGKINIAVLDENITSNNLLHRFHIHVNGTMILDMMLTQDPQYPLTIIKSLDNETKYVRLNWASFIVNDTRINRPVNIISITYGILDLNSNGKIDDEEIAYFIKTREKTGFNEWITGIIIVYPRSKLFVMSDSSPLINTELGRNLTVSEIIYNYVKQLSDEKSKRVIIPNYLYRRKNIQQTIPFHSSILFLLFANFLEQADQFIDAIISQYSILGPIALLLTILGLIGLMKSVFDLKELVEFKHEKVREYKIIIETIITANLLDKKFLKNREKILIKRYWKLLRQAFIIVKNFDLEEVLASKSYDKLRLLGIVDRKKFKKLLWLYRVYLKINGKSRLPIVFNWRRTMIKYVLLVEDLLNLLGYTILKKEGFRDAKYLIK
ncbi:DUF4350 domain-containing protein [Staphylothermus hellenicus]|uniref:EF-hand domain-containing protein n=1 Tax=Staphylothermus hellenicus (strain DSM 12710 / JCM 10830 / BK20S6-10-b1 / P8) TaxID=591019 RepID=D7DBF1_STAHD|nr:DUF4350 domain-containing protein [Staphylothermus hellenicus]ADI31498.1 hypothetical protein Shell_0366 [Staphylothermus hellenicus DSM 12710]